jgi:hypothetical protein
LNLIGTRGINDPVQKKRTVNLLENSKTKIINYKNNVKNKNIRVS